MLTGNWLTGASCAVYWWWISHDIGLRPPGPDVGGDHGHDVVLEAPIGTFRVFRSLVVVFSALITLVQYDAAATPVLQCGRGMTPLCWALVTWSLSGGMRLAMGAGMLV